MQRMRPHHWKRNATLAGLILLVCLFWPSLAAATTIGTVIMARGDAIAESTEGEQRELRRRSEVMLGETLITGAQSRLQVRMVDDALLDLRSNTNLSLQVYGESADPESEDREVLMNLVNGTISTLTGSLGQNDPDAYELRTTNASIGIRGTNYDAQSIADQNTSFTAVNDGTIALRSGGTEILVGPEQAFQFAQAQGDGPPQGLLTPPPSLREALEEEVPAEEEEEEGEEESEGEGEGQSEESEESGEADESENGEGTDGENESEQGEGNDEGGDNAAENASETAQENANENSAVANTDDEDGEGPGNSGNAPGLAGGAGAGGGPPGGIPPGLTGSESEEDEWEIPGLAAGGGFGSGPPTGPGNAGGGTTPNLPFEDDDGEGDFPFDDEDFPGQGQGSDDEGSGDGDGDSGTGDGDTGNPILPAPPANDGSDQRLAEANAAYPSGTTGSLYHIVSHSENDAPFVGYALNSTLAEPDFYSDLLNEEISFGDLDSGQQTAIIDYIAAIAFPSLALYSDDSLAQDPVGLPDQIGTWKYNFSQGGSVPEIWIAGSGDIFSTQQPPENSGEDGGSIGFSASWSYWDSENQTIEFLTDSSIVNPSTTLNPDSAWQLFGIVDTDFQFAQSIEFTASLNGPGFLDASHNGMRYSQADGATGSFSMSVSQGGNVESAGLQLSGNGLPSWNMVEKPGAQFSNGRVTVGLQDAIDGESVSEGQLKGFMVGNNDYSPLFTGSFNLENGEGEKAEGVVAAPEQQLD